MSTDFGDIDDVIGGIPAIKVHLVKSDLQEKRPREYRVTHKTVVLTATSPTYQLMGVDPARKEVHIEVQENQAVLSSNTQQANDLANTTVGLANPNGRILNSAVGEYIIPGGANEIWFSAAVYPTRIGVTIVRYV